MSSFVPHLWIIGAAKIPQPIFVVAIFGEDHFRRVALPKNIEKLPVDLETTLVGALARRHFKQNNGQISCFGKIRYYVYARSESEWWALTTAGRVIGRNIRPLRKTKYSLNLKGKPHQDISFIFRLPKPQ